MGKKLICGGTIINEGESFDGYIIIDGDRIEAVGKGEYRGRFEGLTIDATGKLVMPGVIDDQVHFREPGLTAKADIGTESAAAVAGGITSFMDMPNTVPPTVDSSELHRKFEIASRTSHANHSFYLGATNDNIKEIGNLDPKKICGVKVFMGSSTGNMLVDSEKALSAVFAESPVPVAVHCEYEPLVRQNTENYRKLYGDGIRPEMHPLIRSAEACYRSSAAAVELAVRYGTHLHILHLSTERELSLFDNGPVEKKRITNEICVHHLWFSDEDYARKGNLIKWNPAVKSPADRAALRESLLNGKGDMVATDHAPHTLEEKMRPYLQCPSGAPMVQHSLPVMLELAECGMIPVETVVEKMCHAPAKRFMIKDRGFLRPGCYADIVIVRPGRQWTVDRANLLYKCGWSPLEGMVLHNSVACTIVNGTLAYDGISVMEIKAGRSLEFDR